MKQVPRVLLVNTGLIVAILVVAELVFGSWLFGPSYGNLNLPRNAQRNFDVTELYDRATPAAYTRDEYGLRGRYDDVASIDILAIGGSTTNELFIDDGETWTARLAENFARAGRPISVVNAGVDGQSTVGHLRNFDVWFPMIQGFRTRYVLAYVGINDLVIPPGGEGSKFDQMRSPEWDRRLRHHIMNHSALYEAFRKVRGLMRARAAKIVHTRIDHASIRWTEVPEEVADAEPGSEAARRLTAYAERLRELVRRIRGLGAEAILVTQHTASFRRENGRVLVPRDAAGRPQRDAYRIMMHFNRTTMAVCRETEAICIDLGAEIEFRPGEFYDHVHTTPAGSRRVADFLFQKLRDEIR